jgi:parallel beta-helix repeat protein
LRTAKAAVAAVPSGGTVSLRGGVYHEAVKVELGKSITLQNYPGEAVWFDGSIPLPGWTKSGQQWLRRGWTTDFSSMMGHDAAFKERFIGTNPMAADPDQLFIDGVAQKQVATAPEVTEGRFYVSDSGNTIVIGSDPTGKEVRASDLSQAINVNGPNSVIQGIGVRRYANGYEKGGAIKMGNVGGIIRDVVVRDVATVGVSVSNSNKVIDRVTIRRAGQLGIAGNHSDNSVVRNSIVSDNNTEGFKDAPVAGGIKFCASRTITIKNNEASNNLGTGIWFDVSAYDLTIVGNSTNGNRKYGIEVEVSSKAIVANNEATGGEAGITIFDSGNLKIFNNNVGGSTQAGIKLIQDERRQAKIGSFTEARDTRSMNMVDPKMPWLTENLQVANNVFGLGGAYQIFALDGRTNRAVDTWNLTIDGNLFNPRPTKADPTMVAWGKGDSTTVERYETPAALAAAKGKTWRNAQIPKPKTMAAMATERAGYASTAVPLPADVAAATGFAAGAKVLGTT